MPAKKRVRDVGPSSSEEDGMDDSNHQLKMLALVKELQQSRRKKHKAQKAKSVRDFDDETKQELLKAKAAHAAPGGSGGGGGGGNPIAMPAKCAEQMVRPIARFRRRGALSRAHASRPPPGSHRPPSSHPRAPFFLRPTRTAHRVPRFVSGLRMTPSLTSSPSCAHLSIASLLPTPPTDHRASISISHFLVDGGVGKARWG
jgi:hypothetical protein